MLCSTRSTCRALPDVLWLVADGLNLLEIAEEVNPDKDKFSVFGCDASICEVDLSGSAAVKANDSPGAPRFIPNPLKVGGK